jgi:uncharacterized membrane protein YhaH (DUF805 family)
MDWYLLAWKRAGDFYGRSRRKEYWMFTLFHFLVSVGLLLFAFALREFVNGTIPLTLYSVYSLLALIPSTTCAVRRLHDTGKSGWWLLISAVPFVGLILIVFLALDGDSGANEYGPDPKLSVRPSAPGSPTATPAIPVSFAVSSEADTSASASSSAASAATIHEDVFIAATGDAFSATNEDYDAWNYHLAHRNPLSRRPGTSIKDEHDAFMAARIKARAAAAVPAVSRASSVAERSPA